MFKLFYLLIAYLIFLSFSSTVNGQILTDTKNQLYIGFISTGSEFVIDNDNTYGLNIQYGRDFKYYKGGRVVFGGKASFSNMQGVINSKAGLTVRTQKKLFFDMDLMLGFTSIQNKSILDDLNTLYPDKKHNAPIMNAAIGVGYRFPYSRWLMHTSYMVNTIINNQHFGKFRGGFLIQFGYRF